MKSYQNIEQLKKEWATYGVKINEKGELVASHEGKEYVIGQANLFTEEGKPVKAERKREKERERERKTKKLKK